MKHEMGVYKTRNDRKTADYSRMGEDLFKYLPSEIMLDILLRLPTLTIMSCKCVCKPWLNLLVTPDFVKSHLSQSVPSLAVFDWKTPLTPFKIVEFVEEVDLNCDERLWNIECNFDLPFYTLLLFSSVNGLLFLQHIECVFPSDLVLCNPLTQDYIRLPPQPSPSIKKIYGFGVSRMSCQYKVVVLFTQEQLDHQFECQVHTVGTGSWRGIASDGSLRYQDDRVGAFLNGNLHWLARNGSSRQISCLDLETEVFSTFSPPPLDDTRGEYRCLSVLGYCLCVCDNSINRMSYDIDIWLMEYGDEKSWTKAFSIRQVDMGEHFKGYVCPHKVFKDGDILMEIILGWRCCTLVYYSSKTNTVQEGGDYEFGFGSSTTIFTPSFLSLKTFAGENVSPFD